jgi:hypothetical protein
MRSSSGWIGHVLAAEIREGACFAHFQPFVTSGGTMQPFVVRIGADLSKTTTAIRSHLYSYSSGGKIGRSGKAIELRADQLISFSVSPCLPAIALP